MFSPTRILGFVSGALVLACLLACGAVTKVNEAKARAKRTNDLKQLGLSCHEYEFSNRTFPPDQQAWIQWAQKMQPETVPVIQMAGPGGQYTIIFGRWSLTKDFPQGASNTVLGYENTPSPGGRLVLFADGAVRIMSEAEFNAAPRPEGAKK
jgi:hypothetical protein